MSPDMQMLNACCISEKSIGGRTRYFPLFADLRGRKCVVIGAGKIAAHKIDGLIPCGAEIVVVSPRAVPEIREADSAGCVSWLRRRFIVSDLEGAFLAIAATASRNTNAEVFHACRERGVLCNSVDDPEHCSFIYPALVRRGALQIAISTSGRSPALAAHIRQHLEEKFGTEWADVLEMLGTQRDEILRTKMPAEERSRRLRAASAEAVRRIASQDRSGSLRVHDGRTCAS